MKRKIIGIGETIVDIIFKDDQPVSAKPGGSTFNTLISLGRLQMPCIFISETGNDHLGGMVKNSLIENNIPVDYLCQFSDGKTPIALAFLDEKNNADYIFYKDYPKQRLNIDFPEIEENDILIFGSYFALNPVLRNKVSELLNIASNKNAIIYYDPNFRKTHLPDLENLKPTLEENIYFSDIVRGSDEDFFNIYGTDNIEEIYKKNSPLCSNFICTAGAKGVYLRTANISKHYETPKIKPLSTVGAGDSFNAGILYTLQKYNITKTEINNLPEAQWDKLIQNAILFATDVCNTYENYISKEFTDIYLR
jgi:fructokinase